MRIRAILLSLTVALTLTACGAGEPSATPPPGESSAVEPSPEAPPASTPGAEGVEAETSNAQLKLTVGDTVLTVSLVDCEAARELTAMLPMTVTMSDYSNREKFTRLSEPLTTAQTTKTGYEVGDLCYWAPGNSIAVFYRQDQEMIDGLQKLGTVDSGVELFESYESGVEVTIELIANGSDTNAADKICFSFEGGEIIVQLNKNSAAQSLIEMLPLTLTFQDFAGEEKISYLPDALDLSAAPDSCDPSIGDLTLYAPWGNLAFFYKDHGVSSGLVPLGTIESGTDALERLDEVGSVTIELVDE